MWSVYFWLRPNGRAVFSVVKPLPASVWQRTKWDSRRPVLDRITTFATTSLPTRAGGEVLVHSLYLPVCVRESRPPSAYPRGTGRIYRMTRCERTGPHLWPARACPFPPRPQPPHRIRVRSRRGEPYRNRAAYRPRLLVETSKKHRRGRILTAHGRPRLHRPAE